MRDRPREDPYLVTEIGDLRKITTRPPSYIISVEGRDVELLTFAVLRSWTRFKDAIGEAIDMIPEMYVPRGWRQQDAWESLLRPLLEAVERDEAPADASIDGMLIDVIRDWLKALPCDTDPAVLEGPRTLYQREDGRLAFRSRQLLAHLEGSATARMVSPSDVWRVLRRAGFDHGQQRTGPDARQVTKVWIAPLEIAVREAVSA